MVARVRYSLGLQFPNLTIVEWPGRVGHVYYTDIGLSKKRSASRAAIEGCIATSSPGFRYSLHRIM